MTHELKDRHALICGATEGIGRATALALAERGASVVALARREEALRDLCAALPTPTGQIHASIAVDIGDTDALRDAVTSLVGSRTVHIVLNNTGGPAGGPLADASVDQLILVFRQHVLAAHTILQAVLPGMKAARWGRIVNVISTSVREPIAGLGVSNTIRGAMASWAKTLASELAPHGITVNNVLPGFTETGRLSGLISAKARGAGVGEDDIAREMLSSVPAGRFARPEEPAALIAFLCSDAAGYIDGSSIAVDGGRTRCI